MRRTRRETDRLVPGVQGRRKEHTNIGDDRLENGRETSPKTLRMYWQKNVRSRPEVKPPYAAPRDIALSPDQWSVFWSLTIPHRVRNFWWRLLLHKLPTRMPLEGRPLASSSRPRWKNTLTSGDMEHGVQVEAEQGDYGRLRCEQNNVVLCLTAEQKLTTPSGNINSTFGGVSNWNVAYGSMLHGFFKISSIKDFGSSVNSFADHIKKQLERKNVKARMMGYFKKYLDSYLLEAAKEKAAVEIVSASYHLQGELADDTASDILNLVRKQPSSSTAAVPPSTSYAATSPTPAQQPQQQQEQEQQPSASTGENKRCLPRDDE
ncbi:hypothetical protein [Absidia glauca]|uniref:Reverse transcriptase zinc-binding domain-containing protein n=1 Tax=Absidia glauca TaxID=4829 RepID=A0A163IZ50_ABSGL|nr:hypothetical protein [Absidia glauca]